MGRKKIRDDSRIPVLLWVILGAGALVRLVYWQWLRGNPFFDYPIIDAAEYYGWAGRIAAGEWLWSRVHIHGPAYPYLLALLSKAGFTFGGFYFFQHLLGLATLFLIYDTGRIVAGKRVGLAAAAIALLYPRFVYFEGLLLATTLVTFLDTALLRVAAGLVAGRSSPRGWVVAGLLAGLSAISRPTILIALPALLFVAWRAGAREAARKRAAALAAGVLVFVGPVFLRNVQVGDPVLVQANGGLNFYIANRAGADGLASVRPGVEWKAIERLADDAEVAAREADRDRYYYERALSEMAGEPLHAAGRIAKRFLLFWGGWEIDTSHDFGFFRERSAALRALVLPAALILPLALLGVAAALRRSPAVNVPLLVLLSYLVAVLAFPYASRYRMPLFPAITLFAAAALVDLVDRLRSPRKPYRSVAILAALFVLLNFTPLGIARGGSLVRTDLHLGKRLYDAGDHRGALGHFERSLAEHGEDGDVWNDVGLAREALGDPEAARSAYENALRIAPDHGKAHANLAGILYQKGEIDSAYTELAEAARLEPMNADFRNNLGALLLQKGRSGEAIDTFRAGVEIDPNHRELLYNLGRAYERKNDFAEADRVFRRLVALEESKRVRVRLAYVAEKMGNPGVAEEEYRRALSIDPNDPDGLRGLGVLMVRSGRKADGLAMLDRYLDLRPSDGRIRDLVRRERG
ncbi:MAG: tetratricopeptide repeat protein [Candidatus Eisenbacteria bacterium]